jgi:hypothetical protein
VVHTQFARIRPAAGELFQRRAFVPVMLLIEGQQVITGAVAGGGNMVKHFSLPSLWGFLPADMIKIIKLFDIVKRFA